MSKKGKREKIIGYPYDVMIQEETFLNTLISWDMKAIHNYKKIY